MNLKEEGHKFSQFFFLGAFYFVLLCRFEDVKDMCVARALEV